jgi:RNA polymerase sigma-70 factor, ECF subfamily
VTLKVVQTENESDAASLEPLRQGLHLLALRALGTADAAEEAVQETLARAVAALARGQLAERAKLPAFVAGIARHVVIDVIRARRRLVSLDLLPATAHPAHDPDALGALVTATERARVRTALALLAVADRDLLRLCYVEGLAPGEIAERTGEPPQRIRKRKSRALERLREAFLGADRGHGPEGSPT